MIATVQVGDREFKGLMENSGYVILMKHFGYHKCLEMILRTFAVTIKIHTLIRLLSPFFRTDGKIGDHIAFNFSSPAMRNEVFFLRNSIFESHHGYTRDNIEQLCLTL